MTPESFLLQNTSLICHLKSYKGSPPLHHKVQTPFISADKLPAFFSLSCTNAHTGPIAFLEPALRLRSSRSALAARPACSAFAVFSTSVTKEAFPNTPSRRANGPGPAPRGHLASLFACDWSPACHSATGRGFVSLPTICLNRYPRARRGERRKCAGSPREGRRGACSGSRLSRSGGRGGRRSAHLPVRHRFAFEFAVGVGAQPRQLLLASEGPVPPLAAVVVHADDCSRPREAAETAAGRPDSAVRRAEPRQTRVSGLRRGYTDVTVTWDPVRTRASGASRTARTFGCSPPCRGTEHADKPLLPAGLGAGSAPFLRNLKEERQAGVSEEV